MFEYGPHEVKLAVTGYGRADKDQVQRMVQMVLGMATLPTPGRRGRRARGRDLPRARPARRLTNPSKLASPDNRA